MQQVFDTGSNPLMALRAPEITPHPRGEELPALKSVRRGRAAEEPEAHTEPLSTAAAPQVKIFPHDSRLFIRIDHPVRDLLVEVQKDLGTFVRGNLRPPPRMGFKEPEREGVTITDLLSKLKTARDGFETLANDRADGFGTALTIRSVASEASVALDHTLIDIVSTTHGSTLAETEIAPFLHTLTNLKHGLGQLLQQFDSSLLEFVQQSGMLAKALGGGKEKKQ